MTKDKPLSVAVCGLYCGACGLWRRSHDRNDVFAPGPDARSGELTCNGCRSDHRSKYCVDCDLRECAEKKGLSTCADCADRPCRLITAFDHDSVAHHDGVLDELEAIARCGEAAWAAAQRKRWNCPNCGEPFSWYTKKCPKCGGEVTGLDERG